jgi:hypothetical protein
MSCRIRQVERVTDTPKQAKTMNDKQARWLALYVLCLGDLMIVLDTNIVNVALPSIRPTLASPKPHWPGW